MKIQIRLSPKINQNCEGTNSNGSIFSSIDSPGLRRHGRDRRSPREGGVPPLFHPKVGPPMPRTSCTVRWKSVTVPKRILSTNVEPLFSLQRSGVRRCDVCPKCAVWRMIVGKYILWCRVSEVPATAWNGGSLSWCSRGSASGIPSVGWRSLTSVSHATAAESSSTGSSIWPSRGPAKREKSDYFHYFFNQRNNNCVKFYAR